jgi:hypothetical protein
MKLIHTVSGALAVLAMSKVAQAATTQFDKFSSQWDDVIQYSLQNECAGPLEYYRKATPLPGERVESKSHYITPVLECVLDGFPEFRKAEMAAATVVLGLLPAILQSLGSSTTETSLLGLRRPLLFLLLVAGSPTVPIVRSSQLVETISHVLGGNYRRESLLSTEFRFSQIPRPLRGLLSMGQYLLVGGAVANIIVMAYELSVHAVIIFAPEVIFLVPLWTMIAIVIHIGGLLTLLVRVRAVHADPVSSGPTRRSDDTGFARWLPDEFVPSAFQAPRQLERRKEGTASRIVFPLLLYLISIGAIIHVMLGTLFFSSLMFYSVVDALLIVVRYIASTLVCRAVLRFELLGISEGSTEFVRSGNEMSQVSGREHQQVQITNSTEQVDAVSHDDREISG